MTETANSGADISTVEQKLLEGQAIEGIRMCYDPEIPVNIYDLGLIYDVRVDSKAEATVTMTLTSLGVVATAMILPVTPLAPYLGFTPLPLSFFALLTALLISYLVMVEAGKQWFYKRLMKS